MRMPPLEAGSRLSSASPPPGLKAAAAAPGDVGEPRDVLEVGEEPDEGSGGARIGRRMLAGAALALLGAGALGGVALHVGATAPVCPDTSSISLSADGLCVSPELGNKATTLSRALRSPLHFEQSVTDLTSGRSRVVTPRDGEAPPQALLASGDLEVVSWNVHHGTGPEAQGSRDQVQAQISALRQHPADVYLLQEVAPWQADDFAEGLGMRGYYSAANPLGGQLTLVHPDLVVTGNHAQLLGRTEMAPGDRTAARRILLEWMQEGGEDSPRLGQLVQVQLPDGRPVTVWNAHLAGSHDPADAPAQVEDLLDLVGEHSTPGTLVVGGGDLNATKGSPTLERLEEEGFATDGQRIDWLVARGSSVEAEGHWLRAGEASLSDHPLLQGEVRLS